MSPTKKKPAQNVTTILAEIAKQHLDIETLETRNSDSLDFHTRSVWRLQTALEAAYQAGRAAAPAPQVTRPVVVAICACGHASGDHIAARHECRGDADCTCLKFKKAKLARFAQ